MKNAWLALTARTRIADAASAREFASLIAAYGERGRHYHNAGHIAQLLGLCTRHEAALTEPDAVRFAIWFHDVVYRARRQDNEAASAAYAGHALARMGVTQALSRDVQALILATARHRIDELPSHLSPDGGWFLDFDLAILGSHADVYDAYARAIRKEYAWVPAPVYRQKRRLVLQTFLERPQLYFTAPMRRTLESRARANLAREIASLT